MLANFLAVILDRLKNDPQVNAAATGGVHTSLPSGVKFPAVRVSLIDVRPVGGTQPIVLSEGFLQIDVWADGLLAAHRLMNAAVNAVDDIEGRTTLAFITGVEVVSVRYIPDTIRDMPVPRYVADIRIWGKPTDLIGD